jgi:hypothetical protein
VRCHVTIHEFTEELTRRAQNMQLHRHRTGISHYETAGLMLNATEAVSFSAQRAKNRSKRKHIIALD